MPSPRFRRAPPAQVARKEIRGLGRGWHLNLDPRSMQNNGPKPLKRAQKDIILHLLGCRSSLGASATKTELPPKASCSAGAALLSGTMTRTLAVAHLPPPQVATEATQKQRRRKANSFPKRHWHASVGLERPRKLLEPPH